MLFQWPTSVAKGTAVIGPWVLTMLKVKHTAPPHPVPTLRQPAGTAQCTCAAWFPATVARSSLESLVTRRLSSAWSR